MKKILLILLLSVTALTVSAQKRSGRTQATTLPQLDSQVVQRYQKYTPKLQEVIEAYNGELDSIKRISIERQYNALQMQCDNEILQVYTKNLKVEGVTKRIYSLRTSIPKDQLEKLYKKLPNDVRLNDPYAKSLRLHLDTHQIQVGDTLGDFRATTSQGHPFRYGEFKDEKDVLLIFGSLASLPLEARLILQVNYRDVNLSQLEIVSIFTEETDNALFTEAANKSGIEWLKVCDFKGDHSPLKISFGVEATPMCFYLGRGGAVQYISIGIDDTIIDLIQKNSYKK